MQLPQSPIEGEKLSPKELALLDLQREELKGKFELEKQKAANRGGWIGASIGAFGAICLALVPYLLNSRHSEEASPQKFAEYQKESSSKIEELKEYSTSLEASLDEANKRIEIANTRALKPPTISLAPFTLEPEEASKCEEKVARIALELNIARVRSTNSFIGLSGETTVLVSCATKTIVVSGPNMDKAQNLSRQIREKLM